MKVKDLLEALKRLPPEAEMLVASDEELNSMFKEFEIGRCDEDEYVIYGLSGTEVLE